MDRDNFYFLPLSSHLRLASAFLNTYMHAAAGPLINCDSIPGRGKRFLFSAKHPDRFWDPPSFVFSTHRGPFSLE
jgi:hypothetical protein